jgi:hypothetical protein
MTVDLTGDGAVYHAGFLPEEAPRHAELTVAG